MRGADGEAAIVYDQKPSQLQAYLDKYESSITGLLGTTVDAIDGIYHTQLRIRPTRVRLTAT